MTQELGITARKAVDFSEWYTQVVLKAELADYAPVKGFMVLRPYGYALWEQIRAYLDQKFKAAGHANAYFPSLIPEGLLKREAEHFAGFTPEVFWITQAGDEQLAERLAVRPTSETVAYETYARWVRSWRDLPLKLNFWNSVLRAEIKSTRPFLRTSEFLWQEGHTVHATEAEADSEVMEILEIYRTLIEEVLAIPVLRGRKSDRGKFVGALYTTTLEALMPDGKALQMGTSHNLGQNFAKPFDIKFVAQDEKEHFAWQTSWGVSWRLIGALIMVHGDDKGVLFPPQVAPVQAVLVPIYYNREQQGTVKAAVRAVATHLERGGVRIWVDARDEYTPGWKFNEWELKGVPVRVEIGPRDVQAGHVTFVRRDTSARSTAPMGEVLLGLTRLFEDIQRALLTKARAFLEANTRPSTNFAELKAILDAHGGFVEGGWCGSVECEDAVKQETGADIRLIPLGADPPPDNVRCTFCGKPAMTTAVFGRAY